MDNFKYKMQRFMYGRYGIDKLYYALIVLSFVLLLVNIFVSSLIINILAWIILVYAIFRTFSRNVYKRRIENEKFIRIWNRVKAKFSFAARRIRQFKAYVFHKCPHCKAMLRLPRKAGKHKVECPRCHNEFDMRVIL
jgi:phage FluMu protein Com